VNAEEILRRRREAHEAECAGLEDDYLIQAAFGRDSKPLPPQPSPMRPGFMLKRQAS
jgi:hypothetical protein